MNINRKKIKAVRVSSSWPMLYRCSALPTELSSQLGADRVVSSYYSINGNKCKWLYDRSYVCTTEYNAAFDTVDHNVLLTRLHSKFGISGTALEWFSSYLSGRSQRVMVQGNLSQSLNLDFGVPQGSCLGPLLFTIYASKLFGIIKGHLPTVHCYADDTQLYVSFSPNKSTG